MPWSSGQMSVELPPKGGFLPTTKWSAKDASSNAIWAQQTSTGSVSNPKLSVNGSRIYFSLVLSDGLPPQMPYANGSSGLSVTQFAPEDIWTGKIPPTQYVELTADSLPESGDGAVYIDLSAVDGFFFPAALSTKVNNNTIVIGQVASAYTAPTSQKQGPTAYSAVSRQQILDAYDAFFADANPLFASTAAELRKAYAGLHVRSNGTSIGLENPTYIDWSTTSSATTVLNTAWDNDLNVLFKSSTSQVDLIGDKNSTAWSLVHAVEVKKQGKGYEIDDLITFTAPSSGGRAAVARVSEVLPSKSNNPGGIVAVEIIDPGVYPSGDPKPTVDHIQGTGHGASLTVTAMVPATTYYKGVPTDSTVPTLQKLVLTEYVGPSVIEAGQYQPPAKFGYTSLYATGAVFTVFDPRTVPESEKQAFNPAADSSGSPTPMAVGQQILGNFGVFASTALTSDNYAHSGSDPWAPGDALAQLKSLQRDIVWALNQGNGGILRASGGQITPGSTTAYWSNEENWYPYPYIAEGGKYQAHTPQNLFAQWVHTAGSPGGPKVGTNTYFATYPFGNVDPAQKNPSADYGQPTQAWGTKGAGSGPLMNQTYGFGYDETPAHGFSGANVPAKFLAIPNKAGNTVTFELVFGPWGSTSRPVLREATHIVIDDLVGPVPLYFDYAELSSAAVIHSPGTTYFFVPTVETGTLEKLDGDEWRNLMEPINWGHPSTLLHQLLFKLIGENDKMRWMPPESPGLSVPYTFEILSWNGLLSDTPSKVTLVTPLT